MKTNKFRAYDKVGEVMINSNELLTANSAYLKDSLTDTKNLKLMQFTGLVDINKKEVYEKDILRIKMGCSWQEKLFLVKDIWDLHICLNDKDLYFRVKSFEVVGNIYQNTNLIGKY